jgi:hypothetical protein
VATLSKVLAAEGPLEARVNAGAVVEAAASASSVEARAVLGAAVGVTEGLAARVVHVRICHTPCRRRSPAA